MKKITLGAIFLFPGVAYAHSTETFYLMIGWFLAAIIAVVLLCMLIRAIFKYLTKNKNSDAGRKEDKRMIASKSEFLISKNILYSFLGIFAICFAGLLFFINEALEAKKSISHINSVTKRINFNIHTLNKRVREMEKSRKTISERMDALSDTQSQNKSEIFRLKKRVEIGRRNSSVRGNSPMSDLRGVSGEKTIKNSLGMTFNYIPPGSFMMGSPRNGHGFSDDEVQHEVTLTKGFYMQTTEVTQAQWSAVMGDNPSRFSQCGGDCPVENVSWDDIQDFLYGLSKRDPGRHYRLPTEAEWEYAARAGTFTKWGFGDAWFMVRHYAWYRDNSGEKTHPVAGKKPNKWGLYDMYGNVLEWCQDWYGKYLPGTVTDPMGAVSGSERVLRGGNCYDEELYCRSAVRFNRPPDSRELGIGFRLVLLPGQ